MKALREVEPGDVLEFGVYGPMTVEKVDVHLGGWNGKVELATVRFTTGLGFTHLADSAARMAPR